MIRCESRMSDGSVTIIEKELTQLLYVPRESIPTSGLQFMVRFVSLCHLVVIDFYNDVIMLFSVIQYECTSYSCPSMTAGKWSLVGVVIV